MGAWGTGPFDNDEAGDSVIDPVHLLAEKLFAKYAPRYLSSRRDIMHWNHMAAARASAYMFIVLAESGVSRDRDLLLEAADLLGAIADDPDLNPDFRKVILREAARARELSGYKARPRKKAKA